MTIQKVVKAKFTRVVSPDELMIVKAENQNKGDTILSSLIISVGEDTAATMTIALLRAGTPK